MKYINIAKVRELITQKEDRLATLVRFRTEKENPLLENEITLIRLELEVYQNLLCCFEEK